MPTVLPTARPNDFGRRQCIEIYGHVLRRLGLVDAQPEEVFDRFSRLVRLALRVPVALVTFIDEPERRQYFKSQVGLSGPWAVKRQTPLTHSFCQIVKRENAPLVVHYAPEDMRVCHNLALPDLGVRAYLGVPIHDWTGAPLGALAAIDTRRNNWQPEHVSFMEGMAACVSDQIKLRYSEALLNGHILGAEAQSNRA